MTDLTQMIRWNANFVRGLAESVLNRAKVIRTSLTSGTASAESPSAEPAAVKAAAKKAKTPAAKKASLKKNAVKRATKPGRRTKRNDA